MTRCFAPSLVQHHLDIWLWLALSSSPLLVEGPCPDGCLLGASCEFGAPARPLEQQHSVAQSRVRIGRVQKTNMMQLAAPCAVLPIPCAKKRENRK